MARNDDSSKSDIDAKLRKLENGLDELKRDYDQFFVGSRDRPPRNKRKQVERLVRELEQASVTNTSQKFKMRGLVQRFNSYKTKWNRIQREIEEGTYEPHKKRAERRASDVDPREEAVDSDEQDQEESSSAEANDGAIDLDMDMGEMDLQEMEKELQQMDEEGDLEQYVETDKLSQKDLDEAQKQRENAGGGSQRRPEPSRSASASESRDQEESKPRRPDPTAGNDGSGGAEDKKEKLRKMQDKLGLSSGSSRDQTGASGKTGDERTDERREKLQAMRDRLESGGGDQSKQSGSGSSSDPRGDAKREDVERIRRSDDDNLDRQATGRQSTAQNQNRRADEQTDRASDRESSSRRGNVDRRSKDRASSDEESDDEDGEREAELYRQLLHAKQENGEETDHLTLQAVRRSLAHQRDSLRERHDVDEVDFRIVRKNDRTYLQPRIDE